MRAVTPYTTSQGITRWRVRYREGNTRASRSTTLTFDTERQGQRFARELDVLGWREAAERAEHRGRHKGKLSVDEYATRHIDTLVGITEGTRHTYRRIYHTTWARAIGADPLEDVDRHDVAAVITKLSAAGKSDKTVRNEYGVIAGIFNAAVTDGLISSSPCRGIRLPRVTEHERDEMQILDHDEFDLLLAEFPEHYRPLLITLVGTGIRWGEAEALLVRDLALGEVPVLTVRRAAKWNASAGRREVGPPKTRKGRRTIELAPEVVAALRPLVDGRGLDERVFTTVRGHDLRHASFWADVWRPALWRAGRCVDHREEGCRCGTPHPERCKVHDAIPAPCRCAGTIARDPRPRPHDLRHTAASWMLAAGIPPHVVQEFLGHESIKTTVDVYGDVLPEGRRAVAAAMSGILSTTGAQAIT